MMLQEEFYMSKTIFVRMNAEIPILKRQITIVPSTVEEFKEDLQRTNKSAANPTNGTSLREFAKSVASVAKAGWAEGNKASSLRTVRKV